MANGYSEGAMHWYRRDGDYHCPIPGECLSLCVKQYCIHYVPIWEQCRSWDALKRLTVVVGSQIDTPLSGILKMYDIGLKLPVFLFLRVPEDRCLSDR